MASGLARGAAARGKRIAFGRDEKLIWDKHSEMIFRDNPNVAFPGTERAGDVEWINFHRGNRWYNRQDGDRWVWNYDFRPIPGEVFLSKDELLHGRRIGEKFVVIEPNVPLWKTVAPNKTWPAERYDRVAYELKVLGHQVVQFRHSGGHYCEAARPVTTRDFRDALAILERSSLYVGPEGGLHHGAAAMGVPAVVIFGGFIPPQVTGYEGHINLTGGAVACGSLFPCPHCREAMSAITVEEVMAAAVDQLRRAA
jgi:ADP-heptose:LPS heptosyltransferase